MKKTPIGIAGLALSGCNSSFMKAASAFAIAIAATAVFSGIAASQGLMSMRDVQDACGPRFGHHGFVEQTECILRLLPGSDNPDLMPTDPYIGWYTQMASKMIDDVRNKRISEDEARENVRQAYHEVMLRQEQAASDQIDKESEQRKRQALIEQQAQAEANTRQSVIDERNAAIDQARLDRFCAAAAKNVEDTCAAPIKNPKIGAALCVTARILYAKQGCI